MQKHEDVYATTTTTGTLPSERIGDRLLGALPGKRSFRPNVLWVTVAGLALAAALALWALVLTSRRAEGSGTTPG